MRCGSSASDATRASRPRTRRRTPCTATIRTSVLPRLDGVDERVDGRAERVDGPHPGLVAHRSPQPRVDVLVVGLDDGDLAARLPDGAHGDDVAVVGSGILWHSDGREVVPAGHPREDP